MQEFCAATKEYCPPGKAGMPGTPGTHGIMGLKGKRGSRGRPGSKVKLSSYSYTDLKTNHEYHWDCTQSGLTLRSQIEGYTRLLILMKFSFLSAVIWAYLFITF